MAVTEAPIIHETISLVLKRNFSDYTTRFDGSCYYKIYDNPKKIGGGIYEIANLHYAANLGDKISISSHISDKQLPEPLWSAVAEEIAKRNKVGYDGASFRTSINNVKLLADSDKLEDRIKKEMNNILTANKEASRSPEVLAKLIVANL